MLGRCLGIAGVLLGCCRGASGPLLARFSGTPRLHMGAAFRGAPVVLRTPQPLGGLIALFGRLAW
eukprot:14283426-Alexandrium_andersonii.AAC.1